MTSVARILYLRVMYEMYAIFVCMCDVCVRARAYSVFDLVYVCMPADMAYTARSPRIYWQYMLYALLG